MSDKTHLCPKCRVDMNIVFRAGAYGSVRKVGEECPKCKTFWDNEELAHVHV